MFNKLRNRIILITMAITTAILALSGTLIMLFSSTTRPEPKFRIELDYNVSQVGDQEIREFIKTDREEGATRLLVTLLAVGAIIEVMAFIIVYFASQKIVEPVKDSYDKQKLFIANASHELKTPLAVIEANVEALEVDKKNENWKNNIETEITHANKLVLDLLQLAKMDAGSIEKPAPEEVDLKSEIEKRIDIFKPKFKGQISFKSSADPKPQTLEKQDFLQILDILLDNATKYGDQKVTVVLDKNILSVSNDGATISKADQEKVFDRFYQADSGKEGAGLGLAIAKSLTERNGWAINCESQKNKTKFALKFENKNR